MPDLQLLGHRIKQPIDHPEGSVTNKKLYSGLFGTVYAFWYFANNMAVYHHENPFFDVTVHALKQSITDIGFVTIGRDGLRIQIRLAPPSGSTFQTTYYSIEIVTSRSTSDFISWRCISGTCTILGYEAVNLSDYHYLIGGSIAGSTIKGFRAWLDMQAYRTDTPKFAVTDTNLVSGLFSLGHVRGYHQHYFPLTYIDYPWSEGARSQVVIETEIENGAPKFLSALYDPVFPIIPEPIRNEYKEYLKLKQKGLEDDEIAFLLGRIPKKKIDLLSVTNGAVDCRTPSYCLYAVFDSNPYNPNAVIGQYEYAKRKGHTVYKPRYFSYTDFYRREKEKRDWLITENELAYQLFGREDLELRAVADFYWREVVELNRVPLEPQVIRTIELWVKRATELNLHDVVVKLNSVLKK